jgi:hypothetical protein
MSETRGIPALSENDYVILDSIIQFSALIQPPTADTSSLPIIVSMRSTVDREIGVTMARRVSNSGTGTAVRKRTREYKNHGIKQKFIFYKLSPMPPPPVLPCLNAGEKVTLMRK